MFHRATFKAFDASLSSISMIMVVVSQVFLSWCLLAWYWLCSGERDFAWSIFLTRYYLAKMNPCVCTSRKSESKLSTHHGKILQSVFLTPWQIHCVQCTVQGVLLKERHNTQEKVFFQIASIINAWMCGIYFASLISIAENSLRQCDVSQEFSPLCIAGLDSNVS